VEGSNAEYFALRQHVEREGLLQAHPNLYMRKLIEVHALLIISLGVLICWGDNFLVQMANAVFLAFVFGQMGFLMHDVGHPPSSNGRDRPLHMYLNLVLGWCMDWWIKKHNRHHSRPNVHGEDPDIDIRFLAFSRKQAEEKRGLCLITTRFQHILFVFLLIGEIWHLRVACIIHSWKARTRRANVDLSLMALHLVMYAGLLLIFLPLSTALAFILVHSSLVGVYIGLTFAPNHKGMKLYERSEVEGYFRQQVLTARNIRGGGRVRDALIGYFTGGLNHQIEHHLFPRMWRGNYRVVAAIVEQYCKDKRIPYHAVSPWHGICEVFVFFRTIGRHASNRSSC
jgi:fatty acid desaturase